MFFGCTGSKYRRLINYAANFAHSSRICVIYVYGDVGKQETFEKYVAGAGINTLVLHLPGIQQDIDTFFRVEKFLFDLKARGHLRVLEEGKKKSQYSNVIVGRVYADEPGESWYSERDTIFQAVANGYDPNDQMYLNYQKDDQLCNQERPAALAHINAAMEKGYVAYGIHTGKVSGGMDAHGPALLNIIRGIYPYGIESDTNNEYAYKLAASNKIVRLTVAGDDNDPIVQRLGIKLDETQVQMSFFPDFTLGATEAVRVLQEWCARQMQRRHCIKLVDVWRIFEQPPFGAYRCNWYLYIFAVVLRKYNADNYCVAASYYSKRLGSQDNFGNMVISAVGTVYMQSVDQDRFMRLMYKMFDAEVPADGTTDRALSVARSWISLHVNYMPVAALDHKWTDILKWREDSYWYESGYETEYLPWLEANFERFYDGIRNIDADLYDRLVKEYGSAKAGLYFKYSYVSGSAVGWLHDPEEVEKRIEAHMKNDVCRECGAPLVMQGFKEKCYYGYHDEKFTLKDIIGLNKKLLGRYQNEYFCIRCLCDMTEQTEAQLYQKVHEFREVGCQMF